MARTLLQLVNFSWFYHNVIVKVFFFQFVELLCVWSESFLLLEKTFWHVSKTKKIQRKPMLKKCNFQSVLSRNSGSFRAVLFLLLTQGEKRAFSQLKAFISA